MPSDFESAKALSYSIYRGIEKGRFPAYHDLGLQLFGGKNVKMFFSGMNNAFLGYFKQALQDIVNANPEFSTAKPKATLGDTVFIIHGHDNELKVEVLLLMKIAGLNAIVLHQRTDKGRTIIDKLIEEAEGAGYAIALLTPDDITLNGKNRARQNVILEIGYFLGVVGKERLRMLVKEGVDIPSDLQGILYEKHDANGAWKMKLIKEIQAVGIFVDLQAVTDSL